jgi:hypothetical protein
VSLRRSVIRLNDRLFIINNRSQTISLRLDEHILEQYDKIVSRLSNELNVKITRSELFRAILEYMLMRPELFKEIINTSIEVESRMTKIVKVISQLVSLRKIIDEILLREEYLSNETAVESALKFISKKIDEIIDELTEVAM